MRTCRRLNGWRHFWAGSHKVLLGLLMGSIREIRLGARRCVRIRKARVTETAEEAGHRVNAQVRP
eukprot:CAMPEP_0202364712 /NCGR_PEP_ID=MMETSP1126-20121109/16017_1 /ASSEMBLY_ACC=CAM_ASM_000457 /TAXON_ID=3047 /ORGANISM="Dunaliella tertiolecta, Strain CCMP1320" /LENGTH=64 /DNA_ID=CAMNT_0048959423 /DNA_START=140 /DNA_END=334 /DNA_ORIENTATION=+